MNKEELGTIFAVLTAVISGLAIPVNKIFVVQLDPIVFTAVRSVIVGVVFLFIARLQSGTAAKKSKKIIKSKRIKAVSWIYLFAIAVIGGAFAFLFFFQGLSMTTAGRAAFLHKTLPMFVLPMAYVFLREKITRKQICAVLLMLVGIVFIYSATIKPAELWLDPSMGDLLVIVATFLWAVENVIARKALLRGESSFVVSFARMFFGGLILLGIMLFAGSIDRVMQLDTQEVVNILVSTAILFGYVFGWYWSIKLINVSKASTILLIAPVISLLFGAAVLREPMPALQLLGSALILIGLYFAVRVKSQFAQAV